MTASDGGGLPLETETSPPPAPPSSPPAPMAELTPAVAYVEAIRRSMPPTQRLVTAEELATWPECRLLNASPTVSAWMAPVSPFEPADPSVGADLDDSLLTGLSALSLDAAHAADSELRAVMAPPVKAAPPPLGGPATDVPRTAPAIPPPSPGGDLVDSRSILYVPVHYDAEAGLLCFAQFDVIHAGFSQGWPAAHRGVLSTVTHESLVVGHQESGRVCARWQSCANQAMRMAACIILQRSQVSSGSAPLLFSFRQVQVPADAAPTSASVSAGPPFSPSTPFSPMGISPPRGADSMSHALATYLHRAQGMYGTAQLPSPLLGGGVPCDEVATGHQSLWCSPAPMRQVLVAFAASRLRSRVRHVEPPPLCRGRGGGGGEGRGRRGGADARPIAPRPGPVAIAKAASGLRFPCPVDGCRYATSRRFNLGVHMRRVRQRGGPFVVGQMAFEVGDVWRFPVGRYEVVPDGSAVPVH